MEIILLIDCLIFHYCGWIELTSFDQALYIIQVLAEQIDNTTQVIVMLNQKSFDQEFVWPEKRKNHWLCLSRLAWASLFWWLIKHVLSDQATLFWIDWASLIKTLFDQSMTSSIKCWLCLTMFAQASLFCCLRSLFWVIKQACFEQLMIEFAWASSFLWPGLLEHRLSLTVLLDQIKFVWWGLLEQGNIPCPGKPVLNCCWGFILQPYWSKRKQAWCLLRNLIWFYLFLIQTCALDYNLIQIQYIPLQFDLDAWMNTIAVKNCYKSLVVW